MKSPAIEVTGLHKAYGALEAVAGIDLHVEEGEILAFLGPNGAGKTTTVEILGRSSPEARPQTWLRLRQCKLASPGTHR